MGKSRVSEGAQDYRCWASATWAGVAGSREFRMALIAGSCRGQNFFLISGHAWQGRRSFGGPAIPAHRRAASVPTWCSQTRSLGSSG